MSTPADQIRDLARFFENHGDSLDLAFGFSSTIHSALLTGLGYQGGFAAGLALISLAVVIVSKMMGSEVDVIGYFRILFLISMFLLPVNYQLDQKYNDFSIAATAAVSSSDYEVVLGERSGMQQTTKVSMVALMYHNALQAFHKGVLGLIDWTAQSSGTSSERTGSSPLWAFSVFNRNYPQAVTDMPLLHFSMHTYNNQCGKIAAQADIPVEVWRKHGLLGGMFSMEDIPVQGNELAGTINNQQAEREAKNALRAQPVAFALNNSPTHNRGFLIYSSDAWKQYALNGSRTSISTNLDAAISLYGDAADEPDLYLYPRTAREDWFTQFSPSAIYGESIIQDDVYHALFSGIKTPSSFASIILSNKDEVENESFRLASSTPSYYYWMPKTCFDLYLINAIAFRNMHRGFRSAETAKHDGKQHLVNYGTSSTLKMHQSVYAKSATTSSGDLKGMLGSIMREGMGLAVWLEKIKISQNMPIVLGMIATAYALVFAVFPMVLILALIPGRAKSILILFLVPAFLVITSIFIYIIIQLGAAVIVVAQVYFTNAYAHSSDYAKQFANVAIAIQLAILAGIPASALFAKSLVFSEANSLSSAGKNMIDAGRGLKTAAAAAATAALAATGIGKVAAGAKAAGRFGSSVAGALSQGGKAAVGNSPNTSTVFQTVAKAGAQTKEAYSQSSASSTAKSAIDSAIQSSRTKGKYTL